MVQFTPKLAFFKMHPQIRPQEAIDILLPFDIITNVPMCWYIKLEGELFDMQIETTSMNRNGDLSLKLINKSMETIDRHSPFVLKAVFLRAPSSVFLDGKNVTRATHKKTCF